MNQLKNMMYSGAVLAQLNNPGLPVQGTAVTLSEVQARIQQAAQFLIVISMVVAVIFIVWGGLKYMFARGDATKAKEARGAILHGLIGAGVILAVGVLLQTVAGIVSRSFFS